MLKRYILLFVLFIVVTYGLSLDKTVEIQDRNVKNYNKIVSQTLKNYEDIRNLSEGKTNEIIDYVLKNEEPSLKLDENIEIMGDLAAFKNIGDYSVMSNDYFTSYGATGVKQVITLVDVTKKYYITISWLGDTINNIDIGVVEL